MRVGPSVETERHPSGNCTMWFSAQQVWRSKHASSAGVVRIMPEASRLGIPPTSGPFRFRIASSAKPFIPPAFCRSGRKATRLGLAPPGPTNQSLEELNSMLHPSDMLYMSLKSYCYLHLQKRNSSVIMLFLSNAPIHQFPS